MAALSISDTRKSEPLSEMEPSSGQSASGMPTKRFGRSVLFGYIAVVLLTIGGVYAQPGSSSDLAVFVNPWAPPATASLVVAGAGGTLLDRSRWPFLLIAHSRSSQFATALYRSGALFVFNPGFAAGCIERS